MGRSSGVFYHDTSRTALDSILTEQVLRPSLASRKPRDVRFGEGQYLTSIEPGELSNTRLSRVLFGHPFGAGRCSHYLAIDTDGLLVIEGREGVFVVPNRENLDLRGRILATGPNV